MVQAGKAPAQPHATPPCTYFSNYIIYSMDCGESKSGVTICIQVLYLLKGTTQLIRCHVQLVTTMLAHNVKPFFFFFSLHAANWALVLESRTTGVPAARSWHPQPPLRVKEAEGSARFQTCSMETWRTVVTSQIKDWVCDWTCKKI